MQKRSNLPVIGTVLVALSVLSSVSVEAIAVWLTGVGILAFCAGRRFMRPSTKKDDDKKY